MEEPSQRDLRDVVKEFMELQIVQYEVVLDVVNKQLLLQNLEISMEQSMHGRDKHGQYWDSNYALNCKKNREDEFQEAIGKYRANQKRLKELKDEMMLT